MVGAVAMNKKEIHELHEIMGVISEIAPDYENFHPEEPWLTIFFDILYPRDCYTALSFLHSVFLPDLVLLNGMCCDYRVQTHQCFRSFCIYHSGWVIAVGSDPLVPYIGYIFFLSLHHCHGHHTNCYC